MAIDKENVNKSYVFVPTWLLCVSATVQTTIAIISQIFNKRDLVSH